MVGSAIAGVGAAAGGIGSAAIGASAQTDAASKAVDFQKQMFQKIQGNLAPYINAGGPAMGILQLMTGTNPGGNPLMSPLTQPFTPTMESLEQTPGYQFTKDQGLQATQNSFAAQGLGTSGAALKGAANYATGLASNTYQQQFQNYLQGQQQIYNMISGIAGTGASAAAGLAPQATQIAGNVGNALIGSGNAIAGAATGGANALTGGINAGLQNYWNNQFFNKLGTSGGVG